MRSPFLSLLAASLGLLPGLILGSALPPRSVDCDRAAAPSPAVINARSATQDILGSLGSITATTSHAASTDAIGALSAFYSSSSSANPTPTAGGLYNIIGEYVARGLTSKTVADLLAAGDAVDPRPESSTQNRNAREPAVAVFPRADSFDAPYDLSEEELRAAIYIPPSFRYGADGAPQPVILVPGSGNTGYESYVGNVIKLLRQTGVGDPVWVNVPGPLLGDAQTSGEYVAYAINYIFGISNQRPVAVFGYSQGNINAHWAYKYWPSVRPRVTDHIGISPDYHGSLLANLDAATGPQVPCLLQQEYHSRYISALLADGGDSAYVPTTNVFTNSVDEIVQPQKGEQASAFLRDAHGVGVSNSEVTLICPGQPAGTMVPHEGILYNPLMWALAVDALAHPGPGRVERLDLATVCALHLAPGLGLEDFLLSEDQLVYAIVNSLLYGDKVRTEPPIKNYALRK